MSCTKGKNMLKYVLYAVLLLIVTGVVAGGVHLWRVAKRNKAEMSRYAESPREPLPDLGKVLVVYYSLSGNTRDIAARIQKQAAADVHEIKLQTPLSPGLGLYYTVWKQLRGKTLPPVAEPLPDFSGYDLVIVGAPVWMYTVATPMQSFLQQADFSGRPVAVFTTQGSNPGTFFADFKNAARNADIVSTIEFNKLPEKYDAAVDNKVAVWLRSLPPRRR